MAGSGTGGRLDVTVVLVAYGGRRLFGRPHIFTAVVSDHRQREHMSPAAGPGHNATGAGRQFERFPCTTTGSSNKELINRT